MKGTSYDYASCPKGTTCDAASSPGGPLVGGTISCVTGLMRLSIACPTTPCTGRGGGIQGILLDLTSKTRPRGGAVDTPFIAIKQSIAHAL